MSQKIENLACVSLAQKTISSDPDSGPGAGYLASADEKSFSESELSESQKDKHGL